jgi:hypothetical protein
MRAGVFRWLLILLALLASAPAAAAMPACHDDAPTAHTMPAKHHAPDAAPPHACLGCVPVGDWLAPRVAAPLILPEPAPVARIAALDLAPTAPPLLRPPRIG